MKPSMFYFPHSIVTEKFYSEKQRAGERPEKYFQQKRVLYWMAEATSCDMPEFKEAFVQGLTNTYWSYQCQKLLYEGKRGPHA